MYYYKLYGLTIASPIRFPEAVEVFYPDNIDAAITFTTPPDWVMTEYMEGRYSSLSDNIMWFRLHNEILIYVENGSDIRVWIIDSDIPEIRLRSYILTGALTFIMFQRNYLVIHGSAIACNNKAYIISGPSGSGKSTTSLELLKKPSVQFATDDICAIKIHDNISTLYPGPPWQKVCEDVKINDPSSTYYHLGRENKYGRRLTENYETNPLPVGGMFIITKNEVTDTNDTTTYNNPPVSIKEITGCNKLNMLTCNLFRGELLNILGITPERMQYFLKCAGAFPIYEITRPAYSNTKNVISELILKRIQQM